jgi:hypothetical protein
MWENGNQGKLKISDEQHSVRFKKSEDAYLWSDVYSNAKFGRLSRILLF